MCEKWIARNKAKTNKLKKRNEVINSMQSGLNIMQWCFCFQIKWSNKSWRIPFPDSERARRKTFSYIVYVPALVRSCFSGCQWTSWIYFVVLWLFGPLHNCLSHQVPIHLLVKLFWFFFAIRKVRSLRIKKARRKTTTHSMRRFVAGCIFCINWN